MTCKINGCTEKPNSRRDVVCFKHWAKLPAELKETVRAGAGHEQGLRAKPTDEWVRKANEAYRRQEDTMTKKTPWMERAFNYQEKWAVPGDRYYAVCQKVACELFTLPETASKIRVCVSDKEVEGAYPFWIYNWSKLHRKDPCTADKSYPIGIYAELWNKFLVK